MNQLNILFTSAGRRGYLIDWFQGDRNYGRVVAMNSEPCPAFRHTGHAEMVPKTRDADFLPMLWSAIERHRIDLVVPLTDVDALILSRWEKDFSVRGIRLLTGTGQNVRGMVDKASWPRKLKKAGFDAPITLTNLKSAQQALEFGRARYPLVVKPRIGTSGKHNTLVHSLEELSLAVDALTTHPFTEEEKAFGVDFGSRIIIQQFINGTEFGMDLLADFSGSFQGALIREKLTVKTGETESAQTYKVAPFPIDTRKLSSELEVRGLVDIDLLVNQEGTPFLIDINPRLGGGYPLSHLAGANLPDLIADWFRGRGTPLDMSHIKEDVFSKEISAENVTVGGADAPGLSQE